MEQKFHITVTYGERKLLNFDSECTAVIGVGNAATLCITNDIAVRVLLAARVKAYLNSLISTIATDTDLSVEAIEGIVEETLESIKLDEKRVDPTERSSKEYDNAIKRLNRSWGVGDGDD